MAFRRCDLSLLTALLLLSAAVGLTITSAYAEGATLCGTVLDAGRDGAERSASCDDEISSLQGVVVVVLVLAVIALALAAWTARATSLQIPRERPLRSWLPALGLLVLPLMVAVRLLTTYVTDAGDTTQGIYYASQLLLVPGAVALAVVLSIALRCGLRRDVGLAAGAVGLSLLWLTQQLSTLGGDFASEATLSERTRPFFLDDVTRIWSDDKQLLLSAVVGVVVLAVAVAVQRSGRGVPAPRASWALLALAVVAGTLALHLGQLPGTSTPPDLVLVLLLVAPAVLAAGVVAVAPSSEPVEVVAHEV